MTNRIAYALGVAALLALATPLAARAQNDPPTGPPGRGRGGAQNGMGLRALQILQDLQMASSPELASAVNELLSDTSAHMQMAPRATASAADSARAAAIVAQARGALAKYQDVAVAEKDGYVKFLPWLEDQSIFHYNNIANVLATLSAFDATKPVSLLYKKGEKGEMVLVGAMYSAVPNATPQDLDARLPLGVAHWHEHVNFCGPSPDSVRAGTAKVDAPSIAKWLQITSRSECTTAGGRFIPRLFGWMAHVYMFAGDDPTVIWGGDDRDHMHVHKHG